MGHAKTAATLLLSAATFFVCFYPKDADAASSRRKPLLRRQPTQEEFDTIEAQLTETWELLRGMLRENGVGDIGDAPFVGQEGLSMPPVSPPEPQVSLAEENLEQLQQEEEGAAEGDQETSPVAPPEEGAAEDKREGTSPVAPEEEGGAEDKREETSPAAPKEESKRRTKKPPLPPPRRTPVRAPPVLQATNTEELEAVLRKQRERAGEEGARPTDGEQSEQPSGRHAPPVKAKPAVAPKPVGRKPSNP